MQTYIRAARRRLQPHVRTIQLASSYLLIIMVMSVSFSAVLYRTSTHEIGRQLPPKSWYQQLIDSDSDLFRDYLSARIEAGQHELLIRFIILNLCVLIIGAFISYILARRTLEPIEEAIEAQSRFASDASHELRTPLASIQTENEVALRNDNLTLSRAKQLLASNVEEAHRLQSLAEGLLQLAREDNQLPELQPVSLSDATSEAINDNVKIAQKRHITIDDTVANIGVLADPTALARVIAILIENALKYSPEGSTVTLKAGNKGKEAFVSVVDHGIGIRKKDLPHIFERFYRADPSRTSQQTGGHGLGLALAHKLAEQQNGRITVDSKPDQGSTFSLWLSAT